MERGIFSEEHIIFRDSFIKYLEKEVVPHYEEWEKNGIVPKEAWLKMGENGFLCPWVSEEYGEQGPVSNTRSLLLRRSTAET